MFDPDSLYRIDTGLRSRSVSFENPTGEKGAGGRAGSPLGPGRKGDPARSVRAGETQLLADIRGPGTIRHLWATTLARPEILRAALIRITWEDQIHPSVEAPLGDFFGFAHGATPSFQSALHSVGERYGLNAWIPMPFTTRAKIEIVNESSQPMTFFYQIDYTEGDPHPASVGRLHTLFRRENPTTLGRDFEILPRRESPGRYLGSVIGVRPLEPDWWGEGEIKIYLDGDREYATIVGTGSEDYVGLSWGIQQTAFAYLGASRVDDEGQGPVSMYRWHVQDPVLWESDVLITMQQIGHRGVPRSLDEYKSNLFERADDWSTCTFWYEPTPSAPLPSIPDAAARCADL